MMKKRILVVLPSINQANGASSYILNYYKKIDSNLIHMDFLVVKKSEKKCYENILKKGDTVFELIKGKESLFKYLKRIDRFFEENASNYDIIHCHTYNSGAFILRSAKKHGISKRILHSLVTVSSDILSHRIVNSFLIPIARFYATDYFACSKLAGKFLFRNKKFTIINIAIEAEKYKFDENIRKQIRKELKIENDFVIGNVGRLCNQKNQIFLLKVFKEINNKLKNAKLLIVGDGSLDNKLKNFVKENNMEKNVIFLGVRSDLEKIYNAMDVFCLTSLYEGLPVVGVQAQYNGLPCVFSKNITNEVKITSNVDFVNLKEPVNLWSDAILKFKNMNQRPDNTREISQKYNIDKEYITLQNIYLEMIENERK